MVWKSNCKYLKCATTVGANFRETSNAVIWIVESKQYWQADSVITLSASLLYSTASGSQHLLFH